MTITLHERRSLCHIDPSLGGSTSIVYRKPRFYSPAVGRFTEMDDFAGDVQSPQSLHKYLYCHADPVNNIDPTGQSALGYMMSIFGFYFEDKNPGAHDGPVWNAGSIHAPNFDAKRGLGGNFNPLYDSIAIQKMRKTLTNYTSNLPPQEQALAKKELERLISTARSIPSQMGRRRNDCVQWANDVLEKFDKPHTKAFKVNFQAWDYLGVADFRLGHAAVKVRISDGSLFYLDDGWWGGAFLPEDIPPYVKEYNP